MNISPNMHVHQKPNSPSLNLLNLTLDYGQIKVERKLFVGLRKNVNAGCEEAKAGHFYVAS